MSSVCWTQCQVWGMCMDLASWGLPVCSGQLPSTPTCLLFP